MPFGFGKKKPDDAGPAAMPRNPSPALVREAKTRPGGWVYEIVGQFGPEDHIPPSAIRGAWKVDGRGEIEGDFIPNAKFVPPKGYVPDSGADAAWSERYPENRESDALDPLAHDIPER